MVRLATVAGVAAVMCWAQAAPCRALVYFHTAPPQVAKPNPNNYSGGTITPLADHPELNLLAERVVFLVQGGETQVTATLEFHNEGEARTVDMAFPVVTHRPPQDAAGQEVRSLQVDVDGEQQETAELDGEIELGGETRLCMWHIFAVPFEAGQRRTVRAQFEQENAGPGWVRLPYVLATGGGRKGAGRSVELDIQFGNGLFYRDPELDGGGQPLHVALRDGSMVWSAMDYDGEPEVVTFAARLSGQQQWQQVVPTTPQGTRAWGPEQATGAPNTPQAGDIQTAWATRAQDAGEEWLKLEYDTAVAIAEVRVRETYNPGAVSKVVAVLDNDAEVVLWEGADPTTTAPADFVVKAPGQVTAKSVKVYLDTRRKAGWNEIDAVELVGKDGTRQWASTATSSTFFGDGGGAGEQWIEMGGGAPQGIIFTFPHGAGGPGAGPLGLAPTKPVPTPTPPPPPELR